MLSIKETAESIKDSVLKHVPAKYIYLFGSYAHGTPTEDSDIDIFVVTPDDTKDFSMLYAKVIGDLGDKKIYFVDLMFDTESSFHARREKRTFERIIYQQGKVLYEH